MCPVPDDPGLIPAFWTIQEHRTAYADEDGIEMFFDLVNMSNIRPIKALEDMLLTEKINLQYYGINSRVVRPLCEALTRNVFVNTVNLTGNWLSEDACYHLNDLLLRNNIVHTLLLAGCKIGPGGAAKFYDGISETTTLKTLDLSDCNIRSEGFDPIARAMCNNESIETLLLNNNNLDETCADGLQKLISCSSTLQRLGLSWNSLYPADLWRKLLKGFEENETLIDLDLSWNALGKECVPHLRRLLLRSPPLKKLNLNGNRFYDEDVVFLARGLSRNERLEELYMGNNPMKGEGTLALIKALTPDRAPNSPLRLLDLTNVWAQKNIIPELEKIRNNKPWLDIRLGGILSNYKLKGPDVQAILLKRANYEAMKPKRKRRRRNFGHFVLSLSDESVSKGRFVQLIKRFRLKLSPTLVDALVGAFSGLKRTVDQGLLKSIYLKHYPDTKPPPIKPPKKKKDKGKDKKEKGTKTKEQQ
ncbi:NLR family CARD domain-containing protein 3-like [Ceratina calcarata]|uniref:NLR family CARD domain-containing protein 3-like n=1 Tax=Ceratina calcarata TaxID=156304 RepID=A0AAJ7WAG7_9HYME|nr:NLR family CARD domain-containing protein 3-like [Ceratina calcarata]